MSETKVKMYATNGQYVGHFSNPAIEQYPEGEYEITGTFFDETGKPTIKLDFNPEALPYTVDFSDVPNLPHVRLINVYIQRGRNPICVTGLGKN